MTPACCNRADGGLLSLLVVDLLFVVALLDRASVGHSRPDAEFWQHPFLEGEPDHHRADHVQQFHKSTSDLLVDNILPAPQKSIRLAGILIVTADQSAAIVSPDYKYL
jgi:hypothetical protein